MNQLNVSIASPERILFEGEAWSVEIPGVAGAFRVLPGHTGLVSQLDVGIVTLYNSDGKQTKYAIDMGFVEIKDDKVIVLVEGAAKAEEVNAEKEKAKLAELLQKVEVRDQIYVKEAAIKSCRTRLALVEENPILQ